MKKPRKATKKFIGFIVTIGVITATFCACNAQNDRKPKETACTTTESSVTSTAIATVTTTVEETSTVTTTTLPDAGDIIFEKVYVRSTPQRTPDNIICVLEEGDHVTPVEGQESIYSESDGVRFRFCIVDDAGLSGWIVADAIQ